MKFTQLWARRYSLDCFDQQDQPFLSEILNSLGICFSTVVEVDAAQPSSAAESPKLSLRELFNVKAAKLTEQLRKEQGRNSPLGKRKQLASPVRTVKMSRSSEWKESKRTAEIVRSARSPSASTGLGEGLGIHRASFTANQPAQSLMNSSVLRAASSAEDSDGIAALSPRSRRSMSVNPEMLQRKQKHRSDTLQRGGNWKASSFEGQQPQKTIGAVEGASKGSVQRSKSNIEGNESDSSKASPPLAAEATVNASTQSTESVGSTEGEAVGPEAVDSETGLSRDAIIELARTTRSAVYQQAKRIHLLQIWNEGADQSLFTSMRWLTTDQRAYRMRARAYVASMSSCCFIVSASCHPSNTAFHNGYWPLYLEHAPLHVQLHAYPPMEQRGCLSRIEQFCVPKL